MYPRKRAIFYFFWLLFWLNAFFVNEFYDFKTGNNTGKVVNFLNERQIIVGLIPISLEPDRIVYESVCTVWNPITVIVLQISVTGIEKLLAIIFQSKKAK